MAIITTIIVGLVIGLIAKFVMPGKDPGGWIVTIIIGIAGATVGTLIGRALGMYGPGESAGWIISVLGAILLLWIYRLVTKRRPSA
ncbi:MAG TPA: GlsB/YeaQ/YmgE family stress response membrane protein [Gemmatimonadaceae bacterium]|nr:GlsB/YeaQ/YmgE family stress response membrane protein [Gemmatimonadaceae bacterium]